MSLRIEEVMSLRIEELMSLKNTPWFTPQRPRCYADGIENDSEALIYANIIFALIAGHKGIQLNCDPTDFNKYVGSLYSKSRKHSYFKYNNVMAAKKSLLDKEIISIKKGSLYTHQCSILKPNKLPNEILSFNEVLPTRVYNKRYDNPFTAYNKYINRHEVSFKYTGSVLYKQNLNHIYPPFTISNTLKLLKSDKAHQLVERTLNTNKELFYILADRPFPAGNRMYGPAYQNLRSKLRPYLLLDSQPTVEIDYSTLHPSMLYVKTTGHLYEGEDIYTFNNHHRKLAKLVVNCSINARNPHQAIHAVVNEVFDDEDLMHEICAYYGVVEGDLLKTTWQVYREFKEAHEPLKRYLASDYGVKLQYIDSKIATLIIKDFIARDIPILNIHDSFVVPEKYEEDLKESMIKHFQKVMKTKCEPKLKKEKKMFFDSEEDVVPLETKQDPRFEIPQNNLGTPRYADELYLTINGKKIFVWYDNNGHRISWNGTGPKTAELSLEIINRNNLTKVAKQGAN